MRAAILSLALVQATALRVTVLGGNGYVGQRVCEKLVERGCDVTSISKSGKAPSGGAWTQSVKWVANDLTRGSRQELEAAVGQPDVAVSCVGTVGFDGRGLELGNGVANVRAAEALKGVQRFAVHESNFAALVMAESRPARHRRDACSTAWRCPFPTHWFISTQADIWIARHVPLRAFLEAAGAADVALPAPCYRQLFGAAVVLVRSTPWAAGFLATWFGLRCGPKDQPSLWHLVLRAAGLDDAAEEVLKLYHDERCVVDGALTKNECSCVASGRVAADDATCGYYAAWKAANRAFLAGGAFPPGAVVDAGDVYAVRRPTSVEGGRVAYLPNVGSGSLLCGAAAPLRHVKFLRKEDRDPPAACPALPPGTGWKGD